MNENALHKSMICRSKFAALEMGGWTNTNTAAGEDTLHCEGEGEMRLGTRGGKGKGKERR